MLHVPAVQSFIGKQVADAVGEKLGTKVSVGHVDMGLLNRIVIDDVLIYDQSGKPMLGASRLSAKFEISPLLNGRIAISSAQLFGLKANFYKATADAQPNYQFALDSLASKDDTPSRPLDLNIRSLIIRNGSLAYHQLDAPQHDNVFTPEHLQLHNLSGHLVLYQLTDDAIDLRVKRLSFAERSNLKLDGMSFHLVADKKSAMLTDLDISLPNSYLSSDTLKADYLFSEGELNPQSLKFSGTITQAQVTPNDLKALVPQFSEINNKINLSTRFSGTLSGVKCEYLNVSADEKLRLSGSGYFDASGKTPQWFAQIGHFEAQAPVIAKLAKRFENTVTIPEEVLRLGNISCQGEVGCKDNETAFRGQINTEAGNLSATGAIKADLLTAHLETDGINLHRILNDDNFGTVATTIDLHGQLPFGKEMTMEAKGDIAHLEYQHHTYNNIQVDGTYKNGILDGIFGIDDPHGEIALNGHVDISGNIPSLNIIASARHFNPEAMGLSDDLKGYVFDFDLETDMTGNTISNLLGNAKLTNLTVQGPKQSYHMDELVLAADNSARQKQLSVATDFGHLTLDGNYDYETLIKSFSNIIKTKLPTLPYLPPASPSHGNDIHVSALITDGRLAKDLLNLDLTLHSPLTVEGTMSERDASLNLAISAPSITYDESAYRNVSLLLTTEDEVLKGKAELTKLLDNDKQLKLSLNAKASDNLLYSDISFNNDDEEDQILHGTISTVSEFFHDIHHHEAAHVHFMPSEVFFNEMPWRVEPSDLVLSKNNIVIDQFAIVNGDQHVKVSGMVTNNPTDTIHVDLNDLDAAFLSDVLNVKGVDFGGKISGDAFVTSVYDKPEALAHLFIDDFRFSDGRIGEMAVDASWNSHDNRIDIAGHAIDGDMGTTDVDGFVALSPGEINLNIIPHGTPIEFLEKYTSSFMGDIDARVDGRLRLFGPLSDVNLEGKVVANGGVFVKSLNTQYEMRNDTVLLVPNHIIFANDTIYDRNNHHGIITGSVDHDYLSDFTFDINVSADNLLSYDFREFGDDTFCGTVYATGNCHIKSEDDGTVIDIDATPNANTVFYYNAASPEALSNQDFITWNDVTPEALDFTGLPSASAPGILPVTKTRKEVAATPIISSDLRMNFRINATPECTLRLLMDAESGDYIALNGNGSLRASYFDKGTFNLYGNYVVDHGVYELTIQNVIKKAFEFQQGGTIAFGGNPYDAALNLKATYVVNGVPLSDLNLGQSFSANNIRVNCIMNITGTPEQPLVDFDMELPTVSSDAEQMVRSLINSEEELNQQMIYLLAIGRFYNQRDMSEEGQSQTSLAMQSLLSGTISQQINNALKNFIKTSNWNFGANISTGNEGFNNAEYEGMLSGRLLNNRLLINGQFGYRDNPNATTSFIGDFDIRYLLYPNGNLSVKVYNQANDRYFIKNSLNTQGVGLIMKKDFNGWRDLLGIKRKEKKSKSKP